MKSVAVDEEQQEVQAIEPAPPVNGEQDEAYETACLLEELQARLEREPAGDRPDTLPFTAIRTITELFQPRAMSEKHVDDLKRGIANFGKLEPLTVLPVGTDAIVIDGHHRLEAYRRAKATTSIPVRYFEGTLTEALLESGTANAKVKLPMTNQERQNFAWRLVLLGKHSKAEVRAASMVSLAQVGNMRVAKTKLGEKAFAYRNWWQALKASQGELTDMTPEQREEWKEAQAADFADRLQKEFGVKLASNPEIAAMALERYFGHRLDEVLRELGGALNDDLGDEEDEQDGGNPDF